MHRGHPDSNTYIVLLLRKERKVEKFKVSGQDSPSEKIMSPEKAVTATNSPLTTIIPEPA